MEIREAFYGEIQAGYAIEAIETRPKVRFLYNVIAIAGRPVLDYPGFGHQGILQQSLQFLL
jgi:hypothetical protein